VALYYFLEAPISLLSHVFLSSIVTAIMADSGLEKEKDIVGATEPIGGAENTNGDEDLDVDGRDKEYIEITNHGSPSTNSSHSGDNIEKGIRPNLDQAKSYATTASAFTTDSRIDVPIKKKPWYKKINPLRWGATPPIPETRRVCREYNASFLSLVYFQWVAPIMSVSHTTPLKCHVLMYIGWIQTATRHERYLARKS
jgi:hypothetical protein